MAIITVGSSGNNSISGTAGWDTLYGMAGDDTLSGGKGGDLLSGGGGGDILSGGLGPDVLHGGGGDDTFLFSSSDEVYGDRIVDFAVGDIIDLSALTKFKFIGSSQFNGMAGEARVTSTGYANDPQHTPGSSITIDTDGDAVGDVYLQVSGSGGFTETRTGSGILVAALDLKLDGKRGDDTLSGAAGADLLSGLDGDDKLFGNDGNDRLLGGEGSDALLGGMGSDTLTGGTGKDAFLFNSPDEIEHDVVKDFGAGDTIQFNIDGYSYIGDALFGGVPGQYRYEGGLIQFDSDGDRQADKSISVTDPEMTASHPAMMLEASSADSNRLVLAPNQQLNGKNSLDDRLAGDNGNDVLNGLGGNDTLFGGMGGDVLQGGSGTDSLSGGTGNDRLEGGDDNDVLVGGVGGDSLTGGGGKDTFRYVSEDDFRSGNSVYYSGETIRDFAAGDKIDLSALSGYSFVGVGNGFTGTDHEIRSSDYNYSLEFDRDGDGIADFSLTLSGNAAIVEETAPGSLIFQAAPNLTLTGRAGDETLSGGNGNDTLNALAGDDTLFGGRGNDSLNGDDGKDVLLGGLGADTLAGGTGNDTFKFASPDEIGSGYLGDSITDLAAGDKINLSALSDFHFVGIGGNFSGAGHEIRTTQSAFGGGATLEFDLDGNSFADYTLQVAGNPVLEETAPGSLIFQAAPNQTLSGDGGQDSLRGGNGNDTLSGAGGSDVLLGNYGADSLDGGLGGDTLAGGMGADTLTGGEGNDVFRFLSQEDLSSNYYNSDTITDFTAGDRLDFSSVDADVNAAASQPFTFIGNGAFGNDAGELRYEYGYLYGDTSGDGTADFQILLSNYPAALTGADFIL
ncbi:MAG: hypothetical protein EPN21_14560 [Methylococcaceae bacterium]|nr:MAG: hypothetical protein EPN21_14560 [Methylococcaceae bacterium]